MPQKNTSLDVVDLFKDNKLVKVCAPMVRYSKLQFRNLVNRYDCDLTFTPMILADSFCQSEKARRNELTTNLLDTPVITQFAANSVDDFVCAAVLASPYCSGADLNCGCPQRWARELELGSALLKKPELVYDIVRQCRNRISKPFSVSAKIRVLPDLDETINFCKQLESCGITFLSVHARTPSQITGDINKIALKLIKENCSIPIVANGGLTSLNDCVLLQAETNCDGYMIANGLLTNPTLFTGSNITDVNCIQNWLDICYNSTFTIDSYERELKNPTGMIQDKPYNLTFQCFHHHLVFMLEKVLTKQEKRIFNNLKNFNDALQFIEQRFSIKPQLYNPVQFHQTLALDLNFSFGADEYSNLKSMANHYEIELGEKDTCTNGNGKYFRDRIGSSGSDSDSSLIGALFENG